MNRSFRRRVAMLMLALVVAGAALALPAPASAAGVPGFDVRFSGVIQAVGSAGQPWVIGGQTLQMGPNATVIKTIEPVPGAWADVLATRQADQGLAAQQVIVRPEQVRLRGVVEVKPSAGAVGDWVISGVSVSVDRGTKIASRVSIDTGKWVEVVAQETGGALQAQTILATGPTDAVLVTGEIQEVTSTYWRVSGIKLYLNSGSMGTTLVWGAPARGLIAGGVAELQADGTLAARALTVSWFDVSSILPRVDIAGLIAALPPSGLHGEWKVNGTRVLVMPNARIHQEKGLAVRNATVRVLGWRALDWVVATDITVLSSPQEGGEYERFAGTIEALPATGVLGNWTISGRQVLVTGQTLLFGGAPQVGRPATLEGVKRSDGVIVATILRVRIFPPGP